MSKILRRKKGNRWTLVSHFFQTRGNIALTIISTSRSQIKRLSGGRRRFNHHFNHIDKKSSVSLANVHRNKVNDWPKITRRGVIYHDFITLFPDSTLQRCVCKAVRTPASMIRLIGTLNKQRLIRLIKKKREKSAVLLSVETSSFGSTEDISLFKLHGYALKKSRSSNEILFFLKASLAFDWNFKITKIVQI